MMLRPSSSAFPLKGFYRPIPHSTFQLQSKFTDKISAEIEGQDIYNQLRTKLKGTCVYFIGMMGCGKSTVGSYFSEKIGYRFLDTDDIAEFMIEMPIADFFAAGNEEVFREMEYKILMDLAQYVRVVVSTGGGIVERNTNWGLLRHGIVVWLDMAPEDILARLERDEAQIAKRPLLKDADPLLKLQTLLEKRTNKYSQADVTVKVKKDMSPAAVSLAVAQGILDTLAANPPVWDDWKKKGEQNAIDFAMRVMKYNNYRMYILFNSFYQANPVATAKSGVLSTPPASGGSVQYVSLSDIKSGKVKLPDGTQLPPELVEGLPKPQDEREQEGV